MKFRAADKRCDKVSVLCSAQGGYANIIITCGPCQISAHHFWMKCSHFLITSFTNKWGNPGPNKVPGILPHSFQWRQESLQMYVLELALHVGWVMVCLIYVFIFSPLSKSPTPGESRHQLFWLMFSWKSRTFFN